MSKQIDGLGIIQDEQNGFTYEITSNPRDFDTFRLPTDFIDLTDNYYHIGKWRIFPYGQNDNLPDVIKKAVQENSTAPGMLEKKFMMIWGKGPFLYREYIKEGEVVRELVEDKEIKAWLNSWAYEEYLMKCAIDYEYIKGHFTKYYRNKANRIGETSKIAKLEHMLSSDSRLACLATQTEAIPTHVAQTDFKTNKLDSILNLRVYPKFSVSDPFKFPTTANYSNQYTFNDEFYSTPPLFGSLEWLRRSTATPIIFKALSKNSINIKYHVESPQEFWDREEKRIKDNCIARGETYEDQMLIDYRKSFMKDLLKVLASEENTGKVWHTRKILEVQGSNILEHGWKINVIDQKIKDFVSAQIAISQRADRAISTNITMHGSISNIGDTGSSDSGSEQLYAYINFVNSSVDIPEMIIMKDINNAIRVNFPDKDLKMGFVQTTTKKEQDVTPSQRLKNQSNETSTK